MGFTGSFETVVNVYQTAHHHIEEDNSLHSHFSETFNLM